MEEDKIINDDASTSDSTVVESTKVDSAETSEATEVVVSKDDTAKQESDDKADKAESTETSKIADTVASKDDTAKQEGSDKADSSDKATKGKGKKADKDPDKSFGKGIGIMLKYVKPWRISIIFSLIAAMVAVGINVVAPRLLGDLGKLITDAFESAAKGSIASGGATTTVLIDLAEVTRLGIILAVMYAFNVLGNYVQNFLMAGVSAGSIKSVRDRISKKINVVRLGYFDKHGYGDTLSRVTNDCSTIGEAVTSNLTNTLQAGIMIIGSIIAMFVTEWRLALILLATVPVNFGLVFFVVGLNQKNYAKQREYLGDLNSQIEENYSGQAVVTAFRGQRKAQAKFKKTNYKLANVNRNSEFFAGIIFPIILFVANLGYVCVFVFGAMFVKQDLFGIQVIFTFIIYVRLFNNPLGQVAQGMGALQAAAACCIRIDAFLHEEEQRPDTVNAHIEKVRGDVEFEHVKFGYVPDKTIIKDFSANVKAGQKIAIVGPTGAGKTTLINLLMRFYEVDSGTIKIDGKPITDLARDEVRSMFGMVLQDTWLFEGTIKENLVYSKKGVSDEDIKKACKAANIHHFIKTLNGGYDHHIDDDTSISSGQRQLLTIARAMIQDAPMLILDEATSNVDTRTEQLIQDAMDKVAKGRTSFVIAHRLSTIKNADLILVLKEGDIIEKGTHDQLIDMQGFYCDLYNSQFSNEAE